jgi:hypothetical protein
MKLFSWFIKANSKAKQESQETHKTEELETRLNDELNTFNNNTMWPIAKVKTTTMIIKRPLKKVYTSQKTDKNRTENKENIENNFSLVIIPLAQE